MTEPVVTRRSLIIRSARDTEPPMAGNITYCSTMGPSATALSGAFQSVCLILGLFNGAAS